MSGQKIPCGADEDEKEGGLSDSDVESVVRKDPARNAGFSESSSEEESSSAEEDEDAAEAELANETAGHEQTETIETGDVSRRLAVVNLDWDNIRATDIMVVAASFAPANGRVKKVAIYPSDFGRERMQKEETEGPPREIFASSRSKVRADEEESSDDADEDQKIEQQLQREQLHDGEEFDTVKLRRYQMERLRYFYAVISCDSEVTAKTIYEAMDGREYLSTANFFDLRFVPDEMSFENGKPREECKQIPSGYRPNEFCTEALTHSKVRLTWDDDDKTRKEVQKRAFSRAEMDENDLLAYIGSGSSDAESVGSRAAASKDRKASKREEERAKMRAALGLALEKSTASSERNKPVGDMEITFTSALSGVDGEKGNVFEDEPLDHESTKQQYIRKERERKQRRKEKLKAEKRGATDAGDVNADEIAYNDGEQDLGFDDPFFNDPAAVATKEKAAKKAKKAKKTELREAEEAVAVDRRAELELLMADDQADQAQHFDMKEIEKAEKAARKKRKGEKLGRLGLEGHIKDEFQLETEDPRFKALFESHEFAIDPTNPRFKGTQGMKMLLEEGRKKRKVGMEETDRGGGHSGKKLKVKSSEVDRGGVKSLVAKLKKGRK